MSILPHIVEARAGDRTYEARLYYGQDVRETLRDLPEASVHMVATSPPYWGLRDYGTDLSVWGGDPLCDHEWGEPIPQDSRHRYTAENSTKEGVVAENGGYPEDRGAFCLHCNAWRGSLGLEPSPEEFVNHLIEVFRKVRQVLRPDGTLWVNLGDTYFAGGSTTQQANDNRNYEHLSTLQSRCTSGQSQRPVRSRTHAYLKPKDLIGIPWRFALAMQKEGWYLRADILWSKGNSMPESVRDRTTRQHEYVFLFAHPDCKGSYFYDHEAIKEGANRRNKRSVWQVNTKPYPGAHFATWPPDLVRPMILAGTSEHGVCSTCGAPWVRERVPDEVEETSSDGGSRTAFGAWASTCSCEDSVRVPATVLDPFSGSATTGRVSLIEGRHYIGIDLNLDYVELAKARLMGQDAPSDSSDSEESSVLSMFGK